MLPIYICENDKHQLNIISGYVKDYLSMKQVDNSYDILLFDNPNDFLKVYEKNPQTGIYLLDCELEAELNGLELAKKIRALDPIGYIAFTSSHPNYIPTALSLHINTLDFIEKNTDNFKSRLFSVLDTAFEYYSSYTNQDKSSNKFIFIRIGSKVIPVSQDKILYIVSSKKSHKLILYATNMQLEYYDSLENTEALINSESFIRCNRSTIINLHQVKHINKLTRKVTMNDGREFPYSSRGNAIKLALDAKKKKA